MPEQPPPGQHVLEINAYLVNGRIEIKMKGALEDDILCYGVLARVQKKIGEIQDRKRQEEADGPKPVMPGNGILLAGQMPN